MASKAAKKRAKLAARQVNGGRPPREGVVRYDNGRIDKRATENLAQTRATVIEARKRQYGCGDADASDPRLGYALGRLAYRWSVGADDTARMADTLLEAGNRMHADFERYYAVTGIPSPSPRAFDMNRVRGLSGTERSDEIRRAVNRMMGVEGALAMVDEQGKPVMSLTKRVVIKDEDTRDWTPWMLSRLKRGLRQLVVFYGLDEGLTSSEQSVGFDT